MAISNTIIFSEKKKLKINLQGKIIKFKRSYLLRGQSESDISLVRQWGEYFFQL